MFKTTLCALSLCAALLSPAMAKNFAVPQNDPVMTVRFPDDWTISDIDYGFSGKDADDNVSIYVESADGSKGTEAMLKLNDEWMAEQKITPEGKPDERPLDLGSVKGTLYSFAAHDSNGPTILQFLVFPAKNDRVIMMTIWASDEERKKKQADIDSVLNSLKPID